MQNESKKSWGRGVIARYREYLPVSQATPVVTLGEGSTPLIETPKLSDRIGARAFVKYEGLNPTGSFKDRGMTVAVSKALERGAQALICASTGNTSASAAAYAARAGIRCAVILPAGKIASGKMVQAIAHGARVVSIDGNFDDALRIIRELGDQGEFAIVNSINPDRIAGQKTAAFEIVDELGDAPDIHVLPLGNAGNLTAYAAGYSEYKKLGKSRGLPRMIGIQAEHAAPVFHRRVIEKPETVASAIRIGNPASWEAAQRAIDDSGGAVVSAMAGVTDNLLKLAREVSPRPTPRELDLLLATGECAASALVAMAVNAFGGRAVSLTGSEAGILTDRAHTKAKIANISPRQIHYLLNEDYIVVVAGFQGQTNEGETTTLGRGGSDLTAIALAGALNADACQIFTDVDGVFTCDPRLIGDAKKIDEISYDELLEMAGAGSKVMQSRAVE